MKTNEAFFVNNQIKYMYGEYYEYINKNITIKSTNNNDILVTDCFNDNLSLTKLNIGVACEERTREFIYFLKKFWKKEKTNYVIKSDWNDARTYDYFIITYNRKFNCRNQVIFPLYKYHIPKVMKINDTILFKNKLNKLFWRGTSTGSDNIEENIRHKIVSRNINIHPNIDIGFSHFCQEVYNKNKSAFDVLYKDKISKEQQTVFKFILNIEGNDCASSFPWALASNCCPLHNYPFTWETHIFGLGIKPYVHFIPINNDGSDLLEKYNWCLNNLDRCEEIAKNGTQYMEMYLRDDLFNEIMKGFFQLYPLQYDTK